MLEIEINVVCEKCGSNLLAGFESSLHGELIAEIRPCEDCIDAAWEAGREEGYEDGFIEGRSEDEI